MNEEKDGEVLPHPLDLPLLSSKPSYSTLSSILEKLTPPPPSWTTNQLTHRTTHNYVPWLTGLIATPMSWLTASENETIISMASNNLALRAGRTAVPDLTRTFTVDDHEITLFEPGWTGDSIGHKTWGASLLLARHLSSLHNVSTSLYLRPTATGKCLGLGEGTGLLGIAAVKVTRWSVTLTDLPCITGNLRRNVHSNCSERAEVKDRDWMDPPNDEEITPGFFDVIIGSDLFYDPHHPKMVVKMLERYLKKDREARVVMGYPLRMSHLPEVEDFERRAAKLFDIEYTGKEIGMDDWDTEIHCKWLVYKWKDDTIPGKAQESLED
jgi:predicted nicotinamide N-methyase